MLTRGQQRVFGALLENKRGLHIRALCRRTRLSIPAVKSILDAAYKKGIVTLEKRARMKIFRLAFGNPQTIAIIRILDGNRFDKLPPVVREGCNKLLEELGERPLIVAIFGSYAAGTWTKGSDVDVLLIFQRLDHKLFSSIERTARTISGRVGLAVQPVSLGYEEFERKFLDTEDKFMLDIRETALPIAGFELWYRLLARFLA